MIEVSSNLFALMIFVPFLLAAVIVWLWPRLRATKAQLNFYIGLYNEAERSNDELIDLLKEWYQPMRDLDEDSTPTETVN